MPQILHCLKVDENIKKGDLLQSLKGDGNKGGGGIDFGTLAVFTCVNSCEGAEGYVEEYAWRQPSNMGKETEEK